MNLPIDEPAEPRSSESRLKLENLIRVIQGILDHPQNQAIGGTLSGCLNVEGIHGEAAIADALPEAVMTYIRKQVLNESFADPYSMGVAWLEARRECVFRELSEESWMRMLAVGVINAARRLEWVSIVIDVPRVVQEREDLIRTLWYNWAQLKAIALVGSSKEDGGLAGYAMLRRPDIHLLVQEALIGGLEVLSAQSYEPKPVYASSKWISDTPTDEVIALLLAAAATAQRQSEAPARVR